MTRPAAAKCKVCRKPATLTVGLHKVCSYDCGATLAKRLKAKQDARKAKEDRKAHREAKAKTRRRQDLIQDAQRAFNAWVRARDAGKPCVSCGRPDDGHHQRHAGHYKPAGSNPALRFEPDNAAGQCSRCNSHLSGNLVPYREELIRRIGIRRVEWLEGPHLPAKWTREELVEMARRYRELTREMQKCDRPTS